MIPDGIHVSRLSDITEESSRAMMNAMMSDTASVRSMPDHASASSHSGGGKEASVGDLQGGAQPSLEAVAE